MKIFVSLFAFMATLVLTSPSLAGGAHGNLAEKMNALFPPKQAQLEKRAVPDKPELSSPAFFARVSGNKVNLQWKEVSGADEYHLQIATDPNFKWLVANEYHHTGTSYETSGLEAGKQYFWRVAAIKSNNWSTFRKSHFTVSMFETTAGK